MERQSQHAGFGFAELKHSVVDVHKDLARRDVLLVRKHADDAILLDDEPARAVAGCLQHRDRFEEG